jgi:peptidoglycan/LPS O-acetylase OafA/YrhL
MSVTIEKMEVESVGSAGSIKVETVKLSERFNLLDLLRFCAAVSVMLYHYSIFVGPATVSYIGKVMSFGYLGVNFFFILSGFVITASAQTGSAINFAFSRAARLYPAFWAALVFTLATVIAFQELHLSPSEIGLNATILNDYFGVANVDGVYWTLQAEIKFYGCIFFLLLTGLYRYSKTWLAIWLSAAVCFYFFEQPRYMGWVISPSYSFYFISGVCCYLISKDRKNVYLLLLFSIASMFSVLHSLAQAREFYPSAGAAEEITAALIVLSFCVFFFFLSLGFFKVKKRKFLALLGSISYPIYLIHNHAGKILIHQLAEHFNVYVSIMLVVALIFVVSVVIHLLVEKTLGPLISSSGKGLQAWTNRFAR